MKKFFLISIIFLTLTNSLFAIDTIDIQEPKRKISTVYSIDYVWNDKMETELNELKQEVKELKEGQDYFMIVTVAFAFFGIILI